MGWAVRVCMVLALASLTALPAAAMSVVNPRLAQHLDARPRSLVILPPQVFVYELSAGGVPSRMADWETQSRETLTAAAKTLAPMLGIESVRATPTLEEHEDDWMSAHIGLYERVAQSVFVYGRGSQSAWAHKKEAFDYTLGPGLAFLGERTGADAALVILGVDYISSSGRKLAFAAGLALGFILPMGQSFLALGVVDLKTGDLLWMGFDASSTLDTREADAVQRTLRSLFAGWPGATP